MGIPITPIIHHIFTILIIPGVIIRITEVHTGMVTTTVTMTDITMAAVDITVTITTPTTDRFTMDHAGPLSQAGLWPPPVLPVLHARPPLHTAGEQLTVHTRQEPNS
jgi:hypothetical protein